MRRIERRRAVDVDALRSARQDQRRRAGARRPRRRVMRLRDDLGEHLQLADPAGDELGVLGAEVDDEHGVVVLGVGVRGRRCRTSAWLRLLKDGSIVDQRRDWYRILLDRSPSRSAARRRSPAIAGRRAPTDRRRRRPTAPARASTTVTPTPTTRSSPTTRPRRLRQRPAPSRAAAARRAAAGARTSWLAVVGLLVVVGPSPGRGHRDRASRAAWRPTGATARRRTARRHAETAAD